MSHKLLVIVVGEYDKWEDLPLYEAITRKLLQLHAPGATVQRGIMGYGSHHHKLHTSRLFGISDDRPVTISVVHEETSMRQDIIPVLREMVTNGLMFLTDAELVPAGAGGR